MKRFFFNFVTPKLYMLHRLHVTWERLKSINISVSDELKIMLVTISITVYLHFKFLILLEIFLFQKESYGQVKEHRQNSFGSETENFR